MTLDMNEEFKIVVNRYAFSLEIVPQSSSSRKMNFLLINGTNLHIFLKYKRKNLRNI